MTINYTDVVEHIHRKTLELSTEGLSRPDEDLFVEIKFRIKQGEKTIHLKFQSRLAVGTIGVWFDKESMDISVWETQGGESVYEFHSIITNHNDVNNHVDEAMNAFLNPNFNQ